MSERKEVVKNTSELIQSGQLNLLLLGKKHSSESSIYEIFSQSRDPLKEKFSKAVKQFRKQAGSISTADFDKLFLDNRDEFFNADNTFKFFITETQLREIIGVPVDKCEDVYRLGFIINKIFCCAVVRRADGTKRIFAVETQCEPIPYANQQTGEYVTYNSVGVVYQWEDVSKRSKPGYYKYNGRWLHWKEIVEESGWSLAKVKYKCEKYNG
jgi:hypothetical protein